jgi:hypothetical protein
MDDGSDKTKPVTREWQGFTLDASTPWGLLLLFFAIGYMGATGADARGGSAYQNARPVSRRESGKLVYVTGNLSAPDLGTEWVKPGKYLRIVQEGQVYAWDDAPGMKGRINTRLMWTAAPRAVATLSDPGGKTFFHNTVEAPSVVADARLVQDGTEYRVDPGEVEFPIDMSLIPPTRAALAKPGWETTEMQGTEKLVVYKTPACQTSPVGGCERVLLSVLPRPEGAMTFIGDVNDGRIVKLGETLKGAPGDFEATLSAFSIGAAMGSIGTAFLCFGCFLGIWLSLAMVERPLRRLVQGIAFFRDANPTKMSLVLAGALWLPAYLLRSYAAVLAVPLVLVLLVACRKPGPAKS